MDHKEIRNSARPIILFDEIIEVNGFAIANLKNFEIAGIDPASVIFMTCGLDVSKEKEDNFWGIPENFTIFSGQKMLDRIEESRTPQGYRIPKSTEANVDGFITSASNHAATRKTRNVVGRKIQGKGKKKH
ncbi:hypothetical protein DAPPUDRAFT_335456 [Daphnia pulex]|uniref:Uncharacterized protein n=1 Tax=Daphnia pulex TaxID=6669 RepID=E9HXU3_DAPPU|nr:hypothetical protein DAPPUDRAFT_335456 [Daphnia pulex]|eukprot:EFX63437.1 hypothetical protein DAPPUDRAFT_335456 [Daphnia pulex]